MKNSLKIKNKSHGSGSVTMIRCPDDMCYIHENKNIKGKILKDTPKDITVKWLNKNYTKKYKYLSEFEVESVFDKIDTGSFIDIKKLKKYKNKLESVCLLTCEKEIGEDRYKKLINSVIDLTDKNDARDIDFIIFTNKNPNAVPIADIKRIKAIFKDCKVFNMKIKKADDIYTTNREAKEKIKCPSLGYVSGPNTAFFKAINECKKYNTSMFIECDCLISPNWLSRIKNSIYNCGAFWVSGSFYDGINCRMKKRNHINGGTALYATGNANFRRFIDATSAYVKYKVEIGHQFYPYDLAMFDFINIELQEATESGNVKKTILWNYISRNYIKNNLIYNICTGADSDHDNDYFFKLYDFAVLHVKE